MLIVRFFTHSSGCKKACGNATLPSHIKLGTSLVAGLNHLEFLSTLRVDLKHSPHISLGAPRMQGDWHQIDFDFNGAWTRSILSKPLQGHFASCRYGRASRGFDKAVKFSRQRGPIDLTIARHAAIDRAGQ